MRDSARHFRWFRSVPEVLDFLFRCFQLFVDRGIRDGSVPARLGTEGGENGRPARKKQDQIFVQIFVPCKNDSRRKVGTCELCVQLGVEFLG